jgi:hypothetical protein
MSRTHKDRVRIAEPCWYCRWGRKASIEERVFGVICAGVDVPVTCDHPGENIIYWNHRQPTRDIYLFYCHDNIRRNTKNYNFKFGDRKIRWLKKEERQKTRARQNEALRLGKEIPIIKHDWFD